MAKSTTRASAGVSPVTGDRRSRLNAYGPQIEEMWFFFSVDSEEAYREEEFKSWGFASFRDFVEQELQMSYRIVMWRVQIGQAIAKFGFTPEQIGDIGWSKFKEVCGVIHDKMTKAEINGILKYARTHSFREVVDYVKELKVSKQGGKNVETTTISRRYQQDQAKVIERAEQLAMKILGLDPEDKNSRNRASEFVHLEWLGNHGETADPKLVKKLSKIKEQPKAKPKEYASKGKKGKGKKAPAKKTPAKKAAKGKKAPKGKRSRKAA